MVNAPLPWLLTVRELREALDAAHPDQVVSFLLNHDDLASLGEDVPAGLQVVFAVKVDRVSPSGPVFRLTSAGAQSAEHVAVAGNQVTHHRRHRWQMRGGADRRFFPW